MHKFQNNLAQVFFLKRRSSIWNIVNVCSLTATPSTPTAPSTPIHIFFQIWIDCHFVKTFTYPPHPQPHPRPKNILFFFFSNFDCRPPPPPFRPFFFRFEIFVNLSKYSLHHFTSPPPPPPPPAKKKNNKKQTIWILCQFKKNSSAQPRPAPLTIFFLRFGIFVKNNQLSPSCSLRGTYSKSEKNGGGGGGVGLGE